MVDNTLFSAYDIPIMVGLKTALPALAQMLGVNKHALYERQRALTRLGLLKPNGGRGPGSGVRADPESVAMLFIAMLTTDNLADSDEEVGEMAQAKCTEASNYTGGKTFHRAFTKVLSSRELNAEMRVSITSVQVFRGVGAQINFRTRLGVEAAGFRLSKAVQRQAVLTHTAQIQFNHIVRFDELFDLVNPAGG